MGGANFLHDKSQSPSMRMTDIDHCLGTSPSTGAARLAAIRKMFKMHPLDPDWTLPSRMDDNRPLIWMVERQRPHHGRPQVPRDVQESPSGLIPYIPADGRTSRPRVNHDTLVAQATETQVLLERVAANDAMATQRLWETYRAPLRRMIRKYALDHFPGARRCQ